MTAYTGKFYDESARLAGQRPDGFGQQDFGRQNFGWNVSRPWKAAEIAAMVLGFMVFWPVGLAVVGWKIWQRTSGYEADLVTFMREKWRNRPHWAAGMGPHMMGASMGMSGFASSGNAAFDDWRNAELARFEEERKKLAAAEQEFARFMANLRRARDREEFDRFMNERRPSGQ